MTERMSDERWEILRKIPLATKAWYWTHDECVEIAAEMDRLRAENAALKARLAEAEGRFKMVWEAGRDINEMAHAFIAGNDVDSLRNYGTNIENMANAFLNPQPTAKETTNED